MITDGTTVAPSATTVTLTSGDGEPAITFEQFKGWLEGFLTGANNLTPEQRKAIRRKLACVASPAPAAPAMPWPVIPSMPLVPTPLPYVPGQTWPVPDMQPQIWCGTAVLGQPVQCAFNGCGAV